MDFGIRGKVAMVAAASKGLGFAIAESLAKEGVLVSICGRDVSTLETARAKLQGHGAKVLATTADVSQLDDLRRWHEETRKALGAVDILVTNTGGPPAARFGDLDEERWRSGIDSTLMNVVRLCHLVIPEMRKRQWGRIVNLTSLVAKQPVDLLTISSTLRAGLSGLTKALSNELAPDGVLVNALLPGHVMTDRQTHLIAVRAKETRQSAEETARRAQLEIPLRRYGRPEEIGDVVAFLCSDRASYLTGASIQVDGGMISSTF